MRPSDTCTDPVLLAAEVRRLQAVIASGESVGAIGKADGDSAQPVTLTDAERFVLREVRDIYADEDDIKCNEIAAVIDGLLERTK